MSESKDEKKWAIVKYAKWEKNVWKETEIDKETSYIVLSCPHLLVISGEVVLEFLYLRGEYKQIESVRSNASIAIKVIDKMNMVAKFKIYLAEGFNNKTSIENCLEFIEEFQKVIQITQYPLQKENTMKTLVTRTLPELERTFFGENEITFDDEVESFMKENISESAFQLFLINSHNKDLMNETLNILSSGFT